MVRSSRTHEREEILRRVLAGERMADVAVALGRARSTVIAVVFEAGGVPPRRPHRSELRLSLGEREEISRGLIAGRSLRTIATGLGRAPSTVSREVAAGGGRTTYRAWHAERLAAGLAGAQWRKLAANRRLRRRVEAMLALRWSPEQIAGLLRHDHPDQPEMWVSHETIYQSLFVQGRARCGPSWCAACDRPRQAPPAPPRPGCHPWPHPDHGPHQRAPGRGRGPRGARPLGGDLIVGRDNGSRSAPSSSGPPATSCSCRSPTPAPPGCPRTFAAGSRACPSSSVAPSPGTKARRWPATSRSPSTPASRCTSAIPTAPGSAAPTRTPTACFASTSRRQPTFRVHPGAAQRRRPRVQRTASQTLSWLTPSAAFAEVVASTA